MGKKIPTILSTITIALGGMSLNSLPSYAKEIRTDEGYRAWSIEEMQELYYKTKATDFELCGNDRDCRFALDEERSMENPIYNALRVYSMSTFFLSAINPTENYLRAYFRDIDTMAEMMGEPEVHYPLTEAYIAWIDSDYKGTDFSFVDEMRTGSQPDGLHEVYMATSEMNGPNWFPVETEVQIDVPDAVRLELNVDNKMRIFGLNYPSSVMSWPDYSSCVNSSNYVEGMECRMIFDETGNWSYYPFYPEEPEAENSASSLGGETIIYTNIMDEEEGAPGATTEMVNAPNTGTVTALPEKQTELPWWLSLIFSIGCATTLWLFWPKSRKKSKKSVDKPKQMR